jgi:UDP-N-acetylmuramoyl-tripeptide--D-alanyl-D-alanine ligase
MQDRHISKVCIDSRQCQEGALFVALKGKSLDGHAFLQQAAQHGAVAAIVSKDYKGSACGLELIFVEDTLQAMQKMAREALKQSAPFVIGITGSVGKTTMKEMLAHLLSTTFTVAKTQGSQNGQVGVPLTILNQDRPYQVLVLEQGMSCKGEMDVLVDNAPSDIAIVGRLAPVHYESFNSADDIAIEKAKIFKPPKLKKGFFHPANARFAAFKNIPITWEAVDLTSKERIFPHEHLMENFLLVQAAALYCGVTKETILSQVASFQGAPHRFVVTQEKNGVTFIDDSYNCNPVALKTALQVAKNMAQKRRLIAVLGSMKELGALEAIAHQELGMVCSYLVEELYSFGKEAKDVCIFFEKSSKYCKHFLDKEDLARDLKQRLCADDVVLIKGSNSNKMWEVLDFLKRE